MKGLAVVQVGVILLGLMYDFTLTTIGSEAAAATPRCSHEVEVQ